MAKTKQTKVTAKALLAAIGEKPLTAGTFTVGDTENKVEVLFKQNLTLSERRDLVNGIADMLFVEDADGTMLYCPYLKEFAFSFNLITRLTNVTLPEKVEDIWEFLQGTSFAQKVIDALPSDFIRAIIQEANELIDFKKRQLERKSKVDDILTGVIDLIKTINTKLSGEDGKAILEFLKQNLPELKEEISKGLQGEAVVDTAE